MSGALNDTPFIDNKIVINSFSLMTIVFLWGNKNYEIKSSHSPIFFGDPGL
jgi:hypothetical protein